MMKSVKGNGKEVGKSVVEGVLVGEIFYPPGLFFHPPGFHHFPPPRKKYTIFAGWELVEGGAGRLSSTTTTDTKAKL